jgi:hypothetical protein
LAIRQAQDRVRTPHFKRPRELDFIKGPFTIGWSRVGARA